MSDLLHDLSLPNEAATKRGALDDLDALIDFHYQPVDEQVIEELITVDENGVETFTPIPYRPAPAVSLPVTSPARVAVPRPIRSRADYQLEADEFEDGLAEFLPPEFRPKRARRLRSDAELEAARFERKRKEIAKWCAEMDAERERAELAAASTEVDEDVSDLDELLADFDLGGAAIFAKSLAAETTADAFKTPGPAPVSGTTPASPAVEPLVEDETVLTPAPTSPPITSTKGTSSSSSKTTTTTKPTTTKKPATLLDLIRDIRNPKPMPHWSKTTDIEKAKALTKALNRDGMVAHDVTLNLGREGDAAARKDIQGFAAWLRNRINSGTKAAFGAARLWWLNLEVTPDGRLHAHGVIAAFDNDNDRSRLRKALRSAAGTWMASHGHANQVRIRVLGDARPEGWVEYAFEDQKRTRKALGIENTFIASRELRRIARELYASERTRRKEVGTSRAPAPVEPVAPQPACEPTTFSDNTMTATVHHAPAVRLCPASSRPPSRHRRAGAGHRGEHPRPGRHAGHDPRRRRRVRSRPWKPARPPPERDRERKGGPQAPGRRPQRIMYRTPAPRHGSEPLPPPDSPATTRSHRAPARLAPRLHVACDHLLGQATSRRHPLLRLPPGLPDGTARSILRVPIALFQPAGR